LAALAGTALISTTLVHADVLVLKSDVPEIAKRSVLQDDAILDVPENKSIKVILKPSNVTKVIKGPYKGTAKDYAPSALSGVAAKPGVELETGTTANARAPQSRNGLEVIPDTKP
jgi:hypothetical protein